MRHAEPVCQITPPSSSLEKPRIIRCDNTLQHVARFPAQLPSRRFRCSGTTVLILAPYTVAVSVKSSTVGREVF